MYQVFSILAKCYIYGPRIWYFWPRLWQVKYYTRWLYQKMMRFVGSCFTTSNEIVKNELTNRKMSWEKSPSCKLSSPIDWNSKYTTSVADKIMATVTRTRSLWMTWKVYPGGSFSWKVWKAFWKSYYSSFNCCSSEWQFSFVYNFFLNNSWEKSRFIDFVIFLSWFQNSDYSSFRPKADSSEIYWSWFLYS